MFAAQSHSSRKSKVDSKLSPPKPQPEVPLPNTIWQQLATRIQPKLTVSAPDDPYEREADAVADRIMRMPEPKVQRSCAACAAGGPPCPKCEEEQQGLPNIHRKVQSSSGSEMSVPDKFLSNLGPGQPLDQSVRDFMEPRFGHVFGGVRVHTNTKAENSARAVNALAYTVGRDVAFATGQYDPRTSGGKWLLAHELVHVVQQNRRASRTIARVPTKSGVKKSEYSFSTNCGWIDWGHARPGIPRRLIVRVRKASNDLQAARALSTPTMRAEKFGVVFSSASMQVTLARPLTEDEVLAVSLSIFKNLSIIFEIQQEWTDWFSGSSFSQEDLPSNLIAFYTAAKGFTADQIQQYCGSQDIDASLQEFDRNPNFQKNRTFSPVGATGTWPAELSTIDDAKGASLYKISSVSVGGPTSSYTFCPLYRLQGTIGGTDLVIFGYGGVTFTAADDVRVVPTYRVDTDRVSGLGHIPYVEVEPYGQSDAGMLAAKKIKTPIYVPETALVCLGEIQGGRIAH